MVLKKKMTKLKSKIKLFHIAEAFGGGVLSALLQLCKFIDKEKFDVYIIHSKRDETPENYMSLFDKNIKLIYLPMRREVSFLEDLASLIKLIRLLKKEKPDVVHLHSSKAGVLGRIACRILGLKKVFYSPHGFSFLRRDISLLKRNLFYLYERIASIFGGTIVTVSEDEFRYAKKITKNVVLIPNGIDLTLFEKVDIPISNKDLPKIGTAGRITYARNPLFFSKCANFLKGKGKFIWIGDGELRHILEASHNIYITGWKSREESLMEIASLDIYIQPSLWEGMPIAVLEAMALGKPVVASDIIGNRDLVKHGINGFLAKEEEDFLRYLELLIENPDLRTSMGEESRRLAEQFDMRRLIKQYEELYLKVN